jgi:hypothetical protein
MTKWYKPSEKLPVHEERVLIRNGDHIETAFFDASSKTFNLRNGLALKGSDNIVWMQLVRSESI